MRAPAVLLTLALASGVSAQGRPDFSGSWALDVGASTGMNDDERERGVLLHPALG